MTVFDLKRFLDEVIGSGALSLCDEVRVYTLDGDYIDIESVECDTQTSDLLININV